MERWDDDELKNQKINMNKYLTSLLRKTKRLTCTKNCFFLLPLNSFGFLKSLLFFSLFNLFCFHFRFEILIANREKQNKRKFSSDLVKKIYQKWKKMNAKLICKFIVFFPLVLLFSSLNLSRKSWSIFLLLVVL